MKNWISLQFPRHFKTKLTALFYPVSLMLCGPVMAWSSHQALCGEGRGSSCTVSFGDDGITIDSKVIPAARLGGWTGMDKSERTCNVFGVCTRNILQAERQEFTLSYLNELGKKESTVISFINVNAAIKFRQELEAFAQLVKATKGQSGPKQLSQEEASKDILTSSLPVDNGNINFRAPRKKRFILALAVHKKCLSANRNHASSPNSEKELQFM